MMKCVMNEVDRFTQSLKTAGRFTPDSAGRIVWGNDVISCVFATADDQPVRLIALSGRGMRRVDSNTVPQPDAQPIVELRSSLDGGSDYRHPLAVSTAGLQLRFVDAYVTRDDEHSRLYIVQRDPEGTGPTVVSMFEAYAGHSAIRTQTMLRCAHEYPVEAVSSMNITLPMDAARLNDDQAVVFWGDSAWAMENSWRCRPLHSTTLRDGDLEANPGMSSARFARSSSSTWSTGEFLPCGIISGFNELQEEWPFSFMWEIEHNGAWEWEIGENNPGLRVSAYGPEYVDHQWCTMLGEGNDFVSVPVSFAICAGDWQSVVAEMTIQRRTLCHEHIVEEDRADASDEAALRVVYNDYLNTQSGDPRLETELPLIEGASRAGADVFCIDAGWYDSEDMGWWDAVGEWQPSSNRFGTIRFAGVIHDIQSHGMIPGVWIEPEAVSIHSPLAQSLPDSAFFCRHGARVANHGRYLLDFRSPIARSHAAAAVERLIEEFNIRYFKFDYNTTPGVGTDVNTVSAGAGLLEHCRAVQRWIDDICLRHPDVMIENSASGAMRADYAMLSRLDLQSTSNQADPVTYAAIAAGAGLTVLPEQQGNWACAQEEMSDEQAVFTLTAGILGRLVLSGFLNRMNDSRMALVQDAVQLHRHILTEQGHMVPWWPDSLPDWNGPWLAYGLRHDEAIAQAIYPDVAQIMQSHEHVEYVAVWRRSGVNAMYLPVGEGAHVRQVFPNPEHPEHAPEAKPWRVEQIDPITVRLTVATDEQPSARVFEVTYDK